MNVGCKIDMTQITESIRLSSQYSKRTLPQVINTAAYWVAVNAKQDLDYVPITRIDSQLGVTYAQGRTPKGKISRSKKNRVIVLQQNSLAEKIIMARMVPSSKYNRLTRNRWAQSVSVLAGKSVQERASIVSAMAQKMVKRRHSASKFLIAGWIPAIRILLPLSDQKMRLGTGGLETAVGIDKGNASPATEGLTVTASIENDIGMKGVNAEDYNKALQIHGAPGLQKAVNEEGNRQMTYALSKMGQGIESSWKS